MPGESAAVHGNNRAGDVHHVIVPFSRRGFDMKMIAMVVAAVAMAACDRTTNSSGTVFNFAPAPAIAAQISPQTVPLFPGSTPCTSGNAFTTGFDLVIVQTGSVTVFLDQVILRLIDVTGLRGPSVTISQPQLNEMFGSTVVAGSRAFRFRPQFACGLSRPQSISGMVVLRDAGGIVRTIGVDAPFR